MAPQPDERARETRTYRAGVRIVNSWTRWYTRRVDQSVAGYREAEVDLELWEFAMAKDQYGWSGLRAFATLLLHTVAGAVRDLAWRRSVLRGVPPAGDPVRLLSPRRRPRVWIPLQMGHTFDQTNGAIEPERARPYERRSRSFGAAGNAFGIQGGF